tara:strand:+ start:5003 stop:5173 length:171 start_codon:yes stop_codon:yes gene_type:complete
MNPECIDCCNKEEKERYRELLLEICELIHYQSPLKYQDAWLERMKNDPAFYGEEWT